MSQAGEADEDRELPASGAPQAADQDEMFTGGGGADDFTAQEDNAIDRLAADE